MADVSASVARSFGRAASSYDAACQVQPLAASRLLQRLLTYRPQARLALDLGCATAPAAARLAQAFPAARFVGVDIALPMLQQARALARCHADYLPLCADACCLPFASGSIDLIFSSFALQWTPPEVALAESRRVLAAGGTLALSVPVAGSLAEIGASWAEVDADAHVNRLASVDEWLAAVAATGWRVQAQADWQWREWAPDAMTQLTRIKASGAQLRLQQPPGLASRQRLAAFMAAYEKQRTDAGLPLTWQVLELVLKKA